MHLLSELLRYRVFLHEGQTVYKVVRGDVETHTVQKREHGHAVEIIEDMTLMEM